MAVAFLIGRIIVGLYFISSGMRHFTHLKMMAGYAGSKGVPMPQIGVPASGALLLIGGVSILLGAWPTYGAIAILVFLLPTTFMMHNFWAVQDPMQKMNEMIACVFSSSVIVRAPRPVGMVSTTVNSVGETSRTTVSVPSAPLELNASCLPSSKAAPSTPLPIATDATTFPF